MDKITVKRFVLGEFFSNSYLVYREGLKSGIIIDVGEYPEPLINYIKINNFKPDAILATHGHFDHIMGFSQFSESQKLPFYISGEDAFLADDLPGQVLKFLGKETDFVPSVSGYLEKGSKNIAGFQFRIIDIPGHTPGGLAFYFVKEKFIFCGDLIFEGGGYGRTDLPYSSETDLKKSIQKILRLPGDTVCYPGHGQPFSLQEYKKWQLSY